MMIVVQVQDDRIERQPLLAAHRTSASHVLQAVEETMQPRSNGMRILGQRIGAFVGRPERARSAVSVEIFAERLARSAPRAGNDRLSELQLIFAWHLMHGSLSGASDRPRRLLRFYASGGP